MNQDPRSARQPSFWEGLSAEARLALKNVAREGYYREGAILFRAGDPARGIFLLHAGKVKLSTPSNGGRSLVFGLALPGQVLGLSATLGGKPYEVTAEVTGPAQAGFVGRAEVLRFLDQYPEACFQLVSALSQELSSANRQVRWLRSAPSASARLASLLLVWCAERGVESQDGLRLAVPLTEKDMGHLLGVSRETVTRLLGKFRDEQIAEYRGRVLWIRDRQALARIADPQGRSACETRPESPGPLTGNGYDEPLYVNE